MGFPPKDKEHFERNSHRTSLCLVVEPGKMIFLYWVP